MKKVNPWLALGVILLLAISGAVGFYWNSHRYTKTIISDGAVKYEASKGKIISEFPREMFLEVGANIVESYRIEYEKTQKVLTTLVYDSRKTMEENIDMYKNYLASNGWDITHEPTSSNAVVNYFYAVKAGEGDANITFFMDPNGKVTVTEAVNLQK